METLPQPVGVRVEIRNGLGDRVGVGIGIGVGVGGGRVC